MLRVSLEVGFGSRVQPDTAVSAAAPATPVKSLVCQQRKLNYCRISLPILRVHAP